MARGIGAYVRSCLVVKPGKVARILADIAAARVDSMGETRLAFYNLMYSTIVGASITELRERAVYCPEFGIVFSALYDDAAII